MSLNINNKSSLVNNSNEEFNYFTLNKKAFNKLGSVEHLNGLDRER